MGAAAAISIAVWLPIIVSLCREAGRFKKSAERECYTLRQPRFVLGLGLAGTALFFALFMLSIVLSNTLAGVFFLPFCALGIILTIYAIRWKIVVKGNRLEIFQPFKKSTEIEMDNIERVVREHNGIAVYADGKRLFGLEAYVAGSDQLLRRFQELGKMESMQNEASFRVRRSHADWIVGVLCTLFFSGVFIWILMQSGGAAPLPQYLPFFGLVLLGVYLIIAPLRWRIVVVDHLLIYRTALCREKTVPIQSIEKATIRKNAVSLICGGKPIIKVEPVYKGFDILFQRLRDEQVPFYRNGKLVEFDSSEQRPHQ